MDNIKVIRKNTKKLVKNSFFRAKFIYTDYYEKTKIIPIINLVLKKIK